jgi:hypothetical protein
VADREPQRADDRPTGDMTDAPRTERTDHAVHDLQVLAAASDRSVDDTTRFAAERQVAECADCAALFADLRLLSAGLGSLPKSMAVTRDFRISPERAARLRPAGWRGILQGLLGSGPSLRPFASALTTLGIAGLLLTVALPGVIGGLGGATAGGAASGPERNILSALGQQVSAAPVPAAAASGGKSNDAASPGTELGGSAFGPGGSPPAGAGAGVPTDRRYATDASKGTDSLASPTGEPGAPQPALPLLGIGAALSLGILLLGVFLLIRSRARPFDSIG